MTLSERLKALRTQQFGGHGSKAEICRKLGVPESTYASYENRPTSRLPADFVENLVTLTGVSRPWLLRGEGEMFAPDGPAGPSLLDLASPVSGTIENHGEAAAGVREDLVREMDGEVYRTKLPEDLVSVAIRGDSMAPVVLDGQRVVFHKKAPVRDGDLALVRLNDGRLLCKRYYDEPKLEAVTLVSQNGAERPLTVRHDDVLEAYKVVGVFF